MLINAYEMGTDKGGTLNWSDLRLHFVDTFSLLFSSVTFSVWTATLGFAVLAGPFGSYDTMSWPIRTAYWAAVITAAILVGFAARATMRALLGGRHPALFDLGASFLVGIALGPLIWFLRGWMDPILAHEDLNPIKITLNSFLIACGVFVVRRQIGAEAPTSYWSRPATKPETPAQTRLHRRLSCPRPTRWQRPSTHGPPPAPPHRSARHRPSMHDGHRGAGRQVLRSFRLGSRHVGRPQCPPRPRSGLPGRPCRLTAWRPEYPPP